MAGRKLPRIASCLLAIGCIASVSVAVIHAAAARAARPTSAAGLTSAAGPTSAARVVVLYRNGRTRVVENPYLTGPAANANLPVAASVNAAVQTTPERAPRAASSRISATATVASVRRPLRRGDGPHAGRRKHQPRTTAFAKQLLELRRSGALAAQDYEADLLAWRRALYEERHIARWRAAQLTDVTDTLDEIAARHRLTVARLPVLMLTLANNASYWRTGQPLANGASVQFQGSELVWEYYAGSGIQLQVLHTFGEGDGYFEAGPADYPKLVTLMNEMVPLAVTRAGGLAWEYYFNWEGGRPPWVSAMAQATGLEALTDAYLASGNPQYLTDAHDALGIFRAPPPLGVAVPTALGTRYLQYSFAPRTDIINAYLQSLLGLFDYAQVSHDPLATALYNQGNAQAQAELHDFVAGGWSLYQPGEPDPLNYHELVTGFLQLLCEKTQIPVYCSTYQTFESDLLTRPQLTLETTSAPANRPFALRFSLSKYAAVGVSLSRGTRRYLYEKRYFLGGTRSFRAPRLRPGVYSLAMSVTDPVGHYAKLNTELRVCRGGCPPPPYAIAPPTTGAVTPVYVPVPPPTPAPTAPGTGTQTTTTPTTTTSTTPTTTTTTPTTTSTTTTTTTTGTTTNPGGGSSGL